MEVATRSRVSNAQAGRKATDNSRTTQSTLSERTGATLAR